jgi:uncharacterized UPF0146 family protein
VGTRTTTAAALADRLEGYDAVVEVGVGARWAVATELANRDTRVTVSDIDEDALEPPPSLPETVTVVHDDVTDPDPSVYADADAIYALRCPPELQRPLRDVATSADADCLFTTLGTDPAIVPTTTESLPGTAVMVHVARQAAGD